MPYFFTKNVWRWHKIPEMRFATRPEGIENLPKPPFIIVANHTCSVDGYLLGAEMLNFVGTKLHFLGMKPRSGGWLVEVIAKMWVEIILVNELNREKAVDEAVAYLKKGDVIVLFPEGKTNFDPDKLIQAKTGAARMALRAHVPIVPIGLLNGPRMHGIRNCLHWFRQYPDRRITFKIGKPFELTEFYGSEPTYDLLRNATRVIMQKLGKLTGQQYPF